MSCKNIKKECENLWAKNKYYVLSKSHKAYLEIREYLKEKEIDVLVLNEKIEKTRGIKESKKDFRNAILHVWGYFKKQSSEIEKQELFNILEEYMIGKNNQKDVIEYINYLLRKYPNKYLQESTLLTGYFGMKKLYHYCLKISFLINIENVVHLEVMDGEKNIKL